MNDPKNVIIDCDPGVDDALALMLAAASPELRLLGITCVSGNRPLARTARNASAVLAAAGLRSTPVHAGCSRPLAHPEPHCNLVHGEDGLGGTPLPEGRPLEPIHATDFLAHTLLHSAPGTITLIALGPLTNLALVEIKHTGILRRAKELLVMGGAADCRGNVTPYAEFNFHADPLAADVVLRAGAALTLFGLDVTRQAVMPREWIASLGLLESQCARHAHAMLAAYAAEDPLLHDACPVAWAIDPSLFTGESRAMRVQWHEGAEEGRLLAMPAARDEQVPTLITGVDAGRMLSLVEERLARLP